MSLVSCKNCGHRISDKALVCPKCGVPTSNSNLDNNPSQQKNSDEEQMYLTALSCLSKMKLSEAAFYISALLNIINNSNISYILGNNHNSESRYIISVKVRNSEGKFQVFDFDKIIGCITWLLEHDYIKSKVY